MDIVNQHLARGESRWKPNTYSNYCLLARNYIEPSIGKLRLREVDESRIQHWVDGLPYRPETVRAVHALLSASLKEAVRLRMLTTNPASGIKLPRILSRRHVTWSASDVRLVLAELAEEPLWNALYRTALQTGMRPGELMALRWDDIAFAGQSGPEIVVRRTTTRDRNRRAVVGETTKTHTIRRVAIPASVATALRRWKVAQNQIRLRSGLWVDANAVFTGVTGNHLPRSTWRKRHHALCAAIQAKLDEGETFPIPTLHELRHTAATLMLENNEHVKVVSDMLGHDRIETTLNTYQHVSVDLQRSASDRLDSLLHATTFDANQAENG
jgi:integrase